MYYGGDQVDTDYEMPTNATITSGHFKNGIFDTGTAEMYIPKTPFQNLIQKWKSDAASAGCTGNRDNVYGVFVMDGCSCDWCGLISRT